MTSQEARQHIESILGRKVKSSPPSLENWKIAHSLRSCVARFVQAIDKSLEREIVRFGRMKVESVQIRFEKLLSRKGN